VSRAACLFILLTTGGCGAESWSFDHDAGAESSDVIADAATADERPAAEPDAAQETGPGADADLLPETGPVAEAAATCSTDDDCPSDAPLCTRPAGQCGRCSSALDCARDGGASVCNAATGACVQCTSSSDCPAGNMLPYCDTPADRCVQCLTSTECGLESMCQVASHTCTRMF
jgi:Cys-rich repeat protein